MLSGFGWPEILIVLGVVLLIFGPKRLPQAGRALGKSMREFKDSVSGDHGEDDSTIEPAKDEASQPKEEPAAKQGDSGSADA